MPSLSASALLHASLSISAYAGSAGIYSAGKTAGHWRDGQRTRGSAAEKSNEQKESVSAVVGVLSV